MYTWNELKKVWPLNRKIVSDRRLTPLGGGKVVLTLGNCFSITVDGGEKFGGCCHDIIREVWPEYAHLIQWHLVNIDGPMHYLANTMFLAGDRDCWGYRNGEHKKNSKTGEDILIRGKPIVSEGKEPELDKARSVAIAPNATLEQLTDKQWLIDRLPALMDEFAQVMQKTFKK